MALLGGAGVSPHRPEEGPRRCAEERALFDQFERPRTKGRSGSPASRSAIRQVIEAQPAPQTARRPRSKEIPHGSLEDLIGVGNWYRARLGRCGGSGGLLREPERRHGYTGWQSLPSAVEGLL